MPKSQPLNQYFFPNPAGDNVPVTIEAASLEEALAQLNQSAATPEPEPAPTLDPAPVEEPSIAEAEPAEAETKESN